MKDKLTKIINIPGAALKGMITWVITRNRLTKCSMLIFIAAVAYFSFFQWKIKSKEDSSGPEISMESDTITISVGAGEDELMQGVSARDRKDGDVSASLVVESLSSFTDTNTRTVTYAAFDSDNHISRSSRKVIYSDYRPPVFHLELPLQFPVNSTNILSSLSVSDVIDGDITSSVKFLPQGEFSVETPGIYQVEFRAINSAGDVAVMNAPLEIFDPAVSRGPVITLSDYLIYLEKNEEFDPEEYLLSIKMGTHTYDIVEGQGNYDMEIRPEGEKIVVGSDYIDIDDKVNTDAAGNYTVTYSRTVETENEDTITGSVQMIVIVRDGQ